VINTNNNLNNNGNNVNASSSNGPIPSNSLSSSATTATVTSLTNGLQHQQEHTYLNQNNVPNGDWICFNFGKELYTYSYRGVKKVSSGAETMSKQHERNSLQCQQMITRLMSITSDAKKTAEISQQKGGVLS
jgi:hypothetical protein